MNFVRWFGLRRSVLSLGVFRLRNMRFGALSSSGVVLCSVFARFDALSRRCLTRGR